MPLHTSETSHECHHTFFLYGLHRTTLPSVGAHEHYLHCRRSTSSEAYCCQVGTLSPRIGSITYIRCYSESPLLHAAMLDSWIHCMLPIERGLWWGEGCWWGGFCWLNQSYWKLHEMDRSSFKFFHCLASVGGGGLSSSWTKVAGNCMKWIDPV